MESRLVLIDGLPGSGKSTLARGLGDRIPESEVFYENWGENPFHGFQVEADAAEFAEIYNYSAKEVSGKLVAPFQRFAGDPLLGVSIAESYPFQSAIRLLLQMDADRSLIASCMSDLEQALRPVPTSLIYLKSEDSMKNFAEVSQARGDVWFQRVCELFERSPWARNRGLTGGEAVFPFMQEYESIINELLEKTTIPTIVLVGGKNFDTSTVDQAVVWLGL